MASGGDAVNEVLGAKQLLKAQLRIIKNVPRSLQGLPLERW
jgi:hypothetical protein